MSTANLNQQIQFLSNSISISDTTMEHFKFNRLNNISQSCVKRQNGCNYNTYASCAVEQATQVEVTEISPLRGSRAAPSAACCELG